MRTPFYWNFAFEVMFFPRNKFASPLFSPPGHGWNGWNAGTVRGLSG
jgi:hypothetical protein